MSDTLRLSVPLKPAGKARPRVTENGTFMPPAYRAWKRAFVAWCVDNVKARVVGPYALKVVFRTPNGRMRPDLDNAAGAVLDALQDAGVTENDRLCDALLALKRRGPYRIDITLTALE